MANIMNIKIDSDTEINIEINGDRNININVSEGKVSIKQNNVLLVNDEEECDLLNSKMDYLKKNKLDNSNLGIIYKFINNSRYAKCPLEDYKNFERCKMVQIKQSLYSFFWVKENTKYIYLEYDSPKDCFNKKDYKNLLNSLKKYNVSIFYLDNENSVNVRIPIESLTKIVDICSLLEDYRNKKSLN